MRNRCRRGWAGDPESANGAASGVGCAARWTNAGGTVDRCEAFSAPCSIARFRDGSARRRGGSLAADKARPAPLTRPGCKLPFRRHRCSWIVHHRVVYAIPDPLSRDEQFSPRRVPTHHLPRPGRTKWRRVTEVLSSGPTPYPLPIVGSAHTGLLDAPRARSAVGGKARTPSSRRTPSQDALHWDAPGEHEKTKLGRGGGSTTAPPPLRRRRVSGGFRTSETGVLKS